MKRMLSRMLALALILCISAVPALAVNTVLIPDLSNDPSILSLVTAGDSVYLLTSKRQQAQLYRWQPGMLAAETVAEGLICSGYYDSIQLMEEAAGRMEDKDNADPAHAVNCVFSDGETLYGFNSVTKMVFAIEAAEGKLSYTDQGMLPCELTTLNYRSLNVVKKGDWILWHEVEPGSRNYMGRILAFNMKNGTAKQAVLPDVEVMTGYRDGRVLAICTARGEEAKNGDYVVYSYDPDTDRADMLGFIPAVDFYGLEADYSPELDRLVYVNNTRIMGWHPESGAEELGYLSTPLVNRIAVCKDSLVYLDSSQLVAGSLEKGFAPAHSVRVLRGNLNMNEAIQPFHGKHPDVPVYYDRYLLDDPLDRAHSYREILNSQNAPDLALLTVRTGEYDALLADGQLQDLSAYPEIKAYTETLQPIYQDLVTKDGGIYAVPVYANSYNGWFINKEVMNAMGLTREDIPTSLTEMCAFATRWNNEFAQKYPHFTLLNNTGEYRARLVEAIVLAWSDYCQATGQPLHFDDPVFREAMAALEKAELDKINAALKQTNPEVSEYKQALIWTGLKVVGNWNTYMEEDSDRIFIPLTLTEDTPYVAPVENLYVWTINAKSANAEYAAALLTEYLETMDVKHAYVLRTDRTEPIVDRNYQADWEMSQQQLAALEESREESVNPAAVDGEIERLKAYIEEAFRNTRYTITPSAIKNYTEVIAPAAFVDREDIMTGDAVNEQVYTCMQQFAAGELTAEAFIDAMDAWSKDRK